MERNQLPRRTFLQMSASGLLAAGMISETAMASSTDDSKNPIACRDTHLQDFGAPDSWSAMKQIGVTGVEVRVDEEGGCPSLFHPSKKYSIATAQDISLLAKDIADNGLSITAFCMMNHFDERPEQELAWAEKVVEASKTLGVNAIRIDVVPRKLKGDEFLAFAISMGKKLTGAVKGSDVRYGIENHGNTTNDPAFLDRLFEGVDSDALGLTLDTANFYWFGHPLDNLYGIFEKYASRVCHTHCKSIGYPEDKRNIQRQMGWEYGKYCCPVYEGDIDFAKVASILHGAGYQGDFCIEDESLGRFPEEERGKILQQEAAHLRRLMQA